MLKRCSTVAVNILIAVQRGQPHQHGRMRLRKTGQNLPCRKAGTGTGIFSDPGAHQKQHPVCIPMQLVGLSLLKFPQPAAAYAHVDFRPVRHQIGNFADPELQRLHIRRTGQPDNVVGVHIRLRQHLLPGNGIALFHSSDSNLRGHRTAAAASQHQRRLQRLTRSLRAQLFQQVFHRQLPCLLPAAFDRRHRRIVDQCLHGAVITGHRYIPGHGNSPCLQGITQGNGHHIVGAYHPVRLWHLSVQDLIGEILRSVHPEVPVENLFLRNRKSIVPKRL